MDWTAQRASLEKSIAAGHVATGLDKDMRSYGLKDGSIVTRRMVTPEALLEEGLLEQYLTLRHEAFNDHSIEDFTNERATLIALVMDGDTLVGTGDLTWRAHMGTPEDGYLHSLGRLVFKNAAVQKDRQGKHIGQTLLDMRFRAANWRYFEELLDEENPDTILMKNQGNGDHNKRPDGEDLTLEDLEEALDNDHLLVYSLFKDPSSHLGRFSAAGKKYGFEVSEQAERSITEFSYFVVDVSQNRYIHMVAQARAASLPLDKDGIETLKGELRQVTQEVMYVSGPDQAKVDEALEYARVSFEEQVVSPGGWNTYGATGWKTSDVDPAQAHREHMKEYLKRKGFEVISFAIDSDPLKDIQRHLELTKKQTDAGNEYGDPPTDTYTAIIAPVPPTIQLSLTKAEAPHP
jgi:hypothetical protein